MTLTTERLILRRPTEGDWPQWRAFCMTDRAVHFPSMHGDPFGAFQGFAAQLGHWQIRGFGLWAVTTHDDDTALGMIGPYHPDGWPENEIGWTIFSDQSAGKGIATEAATAALRDAYTRLGWTTAVHYIRTENTRSIALAERLGSRLDPNAETPRPDIPGGAWRHPGPKALL